MVVVSRREDSVIVRRFDGVITRAREYAGKRAGKQRFSVTLEAPLAVLRLQRDYRIFQDKDTKTIVSEILTEVGITGSAVEFRLAGSYPTREVCMQHGETTLDFLSRLLEEEGIFYFHEQKEEGPTLVFGDSGAAYTQTTPASRFSYRPESGLVSGGAIMSLVQSAEIHPAKVTLRDHDFKRPALVLEVNATTDAPLGREYYEYPGRYVDQGEGSRRAKAWLDSMVAEARVVEGSGNAFSLTPGHRFEITDTGPLGMDQAWVIRNLAQRWEDAEGGQKFDNTFRLLPADAPYRPTRRTPRPIVPGPQIAHVTGPSGQEIHCDEHGRVKVRFPWDRRAPWDDKSSCWVRVGQMHTGGSIAIPRIGWEVLVEFEDGDPDKPIILGRAYNARYPPPEGLPAKKTVSSLQSATSPASGGFNLIRTDDGAGGELMDMHAQKDMNVSTANNKTEKVGTTSTLGVGADHQVQIGANDKLNVGADYELSVGSSQTWNVGASRTETISGNEKVDVASARSMTIGGSHTTMTPMQYSASTPAAFSETVGGSAIEAAALEVGCAVAGAASVSVGASRIAATASGATDFTLGAKATTVGGAFISASGADAGISVGGAKATTVGGAWAANAGQNFELSSGGTMRINVGGVVSMNAATIVLKVGGSSVSISGGSVVMKSKTIKLTATGPQPELAPLVSDK